jgi:transposase
VTVLGVDVGKADLHCALLGEEGKPGKPRTNSFPNSKAGFEKLLKWLANRGVERVHACMESTGGLSEDLAFFLHERGHVVSIVNPLAIKGFGQGELSRTKTDSADAALIARFCRAMNPEPWKVPTVQQRQLQQLVRRRAALDEMRTQEKNRLEAPLVSEDVRKSIEQTIAFLNEQIKEIDKEIDSLIKADPMLRERRKLLESVPGIGPRVSSTILGEIPRIAEFASGKAVAAFAGLCPREFRSGSSVQGSWLSKQGNRLIRAVLYMPAMTAKTHNPILARWAESLKARGKRHKQIVAAIMRRLLVLAYGVLKSGRPFDHAFVLDGRHRI